VKAITWLFLPLWAWCGACLGMLLTAWALLLGVGTAAAWSVTAGVTAGAWLLGGISRRVVHPLGRLPSVFMALAGLMALTAILHVRLRIAPSVALLQGVHTTGHLSLALASSLAGAVLPVAVRVAEFRRDGPRVATFLTVLVFSGGAVLASGGLQAVWSGVDILQVLLALSLCSALAGMASRRAALVLTNAPSPPTRYQIQDAPAPAPRPRLIPLPILLGAACLAGAASAGADVGLLMMAPLLAAWLQFRGVHPLDAGRHTAWMLTGWACGAALATPWLAGAPR
jgi:hypothetical protein